MVDFPCRNCGHPSHWHAQLLHHAQIACCVGCADVIGLTAEEAGAYHDYVPDNLRYLESLVNNNG